MAKKKSFVLRMDPDLVVAIYKLATQEFRSANGQIEWIIAKALKDARRPIAKTNKDDKEDDSS